MIGFFDVLTILVYIVLAIIVLNFAVALFCAMFELTGRGDVRYDKPQKKRKPYSEYSNEDWFV